MTREKLFQKYPIKSMRIFPSVLNDRTLILLIIMTIVTFAPVYYFRTSFPVDSDYGSHILFTRYLIGGHLDQIPAHILAHPALQAFLAGLYFLSLHKLTFSIMLTGILTASQVLTAIIIYIWLGSDKKRYRDMGRAVAAWTLTLVAPVMLLVLYDKFYYFGYIGLANYHNPTIILLRPFALISFLAGVRAFQEINISWKLILAACILVVTSALIKPNYLLCILPALFILAAWRAFQQKAVDYKYLLFGFLIPSLLVLGGQWWIANNSDPSPIVFIPLGVEGAFSKYLLPKFLLSVLFPLSVLVCDLKKYRDNPDLLLAAIGFMVGAFQAYFLAESGDRFYHGNFLWGAEVMLFIWFVVSARVLLNKLFDRNISNRIKIVLSATYLSHFAAGIIYYANCFLSSTYA